MKTSELKGLLPKQIPLFVGETPCGCSSIGQAQEPTPTPMESPLLFGQQAVKTSCAGFTLIELLVTITILGVIFTIVFGTFAYTLTNAESQQEHAAVYHRASFILNNISRNISSAYVPFGGQYQEDEDGKPIFLGEDAAVGNEDADSLSAFGTHAQSVGSKGVPAIAHIHYETLSSEDAGEEEVFADANNPLVLRCTVESLLSSQDEDSEQAQWALNIRSLNLEYFDGSDWMQEWSYEEQAALPTAVKAELELADVEGTVYTFSTTVRVHVDTPLDELEESGAEELEEEEEKTEEPEEAEEATEPGPETPAPTEQEGPAEATDDDAPIG